VISTEQIGEWCEDKLDSIEVFYGKLEVWFDSAEVGVYLLVLGIAQVFAYAFFVGSALEPHDAREAEIEVGNLDKMVQQHTLMQSPPRAPDNFEALTQGSTRITKRIPKDPWENDYIYERLGDREWLIYSAGEDKEYGTEDDIVVINPEVREPPVVKEEDRLTWPDETDGK